MINVKGGYTNLSAEGVYTRAGVATRSAGKSDGWRAGAGLEYALGSRLYLKAEYRYSRYDAFTDRHQGLAGLGIRF